MHERIVLSHDVIICGHLMQKSSTSGCFGVGSNVDIRQMGDIMELLAYKSQSGIADAIRGNIKTEVQEAASRKIAREAAEGSPTFPSSPLGPDELPDIPSPLSRLERAELRLNKAEVEVAQATLSLERAKVRLARAREVMAQEAITLNVAETSAGKMDTDDVVSVGSSSSSEGDD